MSEFFDALEKAKHVGEVIASNISPDSTFDTLEKGKKATIGEVRNWNGKNYKKQANGKWLEVSSVGIHKNKTKEEHNELSKKYHSSPSKEGSDIAMDHTKASSKLSDKEHSDEEVGLKESDRVREVTDLMYSRVKSLRKTNLAASSDKIYIMAAKQISKELKVKVEDILKEYTPSRNLSGEQYWDKDGKLVR